VAVNQIPLPDDWPSEKTAMSWANDMYHKHRYDIEVSIVTIRELLSVDPDAAKQNPQAFGTARPEDAWAAAQAFFYAANLIPSWVSDMASNWSAYGLDAWKGPAAEAFNRLYDSYEKYVGNLWFTAAKYYAATQLAGDAHRIALWDYTANMDTFDAEQEKEAPLRQTWLFDPAQTFDNTPATKEDDTTPPPSSDGPPPTVMVDNPDYPTAKADFENKYHTYDVLYVLRSQYYDNLGQQITGALTNSYVSAYGQLVDPPTPDFQSAPNNGSNGSNSANDAFNKEQLKFLHTQENDAKKAADAAAKMNKLQEDNLNKQASDAAKAANDAANLNQKQLDSLSKPPNLSPPPTPNIPSTPPPGTSAPLNIPSVPPPSNLTTRNLPGAPGTAVPGLNVPLPGAMVPGGPAAVGPGAPVPNATLVNGPNGTQGLDTTGSGRMDTPLPPGAKVVNQPNGSKAIDLNGDGIPDVDASGNALAGGSAPAGSRLVKGTDGQLGFSLPGNNTGNPDLDLHGNALPGGSLPPGARFVTGADGRQGFDLNGDGVPDLDARGTPLPGSTILNPPPSTAPPGTSAGPGGSATQVPGNQVVTSPGPQGPQGPQGPPGPGAGAPGGAGLGVLGAGGAAGGAYPPMYPPMMGGMGGMGAGAQQQNQQNERERQTWLQEEDEVWEGDMAAVAAVAELGRPVMEEELPEEWELPVRPPARTSRAARLGPNQTGTRR